MNFCVLTRRPQLALNTLLRVVFPALAIVALTLLATTHPPAATAAPVVTDGGAENIFPEGIVFRMSADSESPIEEIRLRYKVLPDGTSATAVPDFEPGTHVETQFTLEGNTNIYLPPGIVVEYRWEVTDATGAVSETEEVSFFYDDARFSWTPVEGGGVTIYYYSGSAEDAQEMHDVALEKIAEMSALLDTTVPFEVLVWTYESTDDMRPALQRTSPTFEKHITTAGVRVSSNTVLVLGNASFDTLRHELTHVVTKQAGESALGTLPSWLDEGTAVYGQADPGGFGDAITSAILAGDVLSVREISSYPGDPAKVTLFYGEGWSLVKYLIDEYGEAKFAELYATVKSGNRIGPALETVYGFNEDGLENEWRVANGLEEREISEETEPPQDGEPVTADTGDEGGGSSVVLIALGVIFLAAVVGVGGVLAARRMS